MLDLSYHMPAKIFYGKGCIAENQAYFSSLGKTCLLITGKNSARASGALADIESALTSCGISYEIFDEVAQNPLLSSCKKAGDLANRIGADFIIGIGGGSPLDAAKAVSVFASNHTMEPMGIFDGDYENPPLPFVLVGTTAGTGSEVTPYSILTVDTDPNEIGRKRSIGNLFAAACFCDYSYTLSLDSRFTISTALDAFSHCAESYFSKKANTISDLYAIQGAKLIINVFRDLSADMTFTDKQRQELYAASIYGGLAITKTGTCYCHSMGYFLTEEYQVPHGIACAVFLPSFLRLGCETETQKADLFLFEMDSSLSNLCDMIENLADYKPVHLTQTQKNELNDRWTESNKFHTSPGSFSVEDAMELVDEIFDGE